MATQTQPQLAPAALQPVYDAYAEGRAAVLLSGRPLHDLVPDEDGAVRTVLEGLRQGLRRRFGMALATYSLAGGFDWDEARIPDERDRRTLAAAFRAHRLLDIPPDQNETVRVIRGISAICRMPAGSLKWAEGRDLRLAILFEFGEHLTPGGMGNGAQTDTQLAAIELAHLTGQSLALRASGNLILFHAREGLMDELVCGALDPVRLPMPGEAEKSRIIASLAAFYPNARFEDGIDARAAAALTANTTNRGIEALMRAADRTRQPIAARELAAQKSRDVIQLSEGTLNVLDTRRVAGVDLCGRNISVPARYLELCATRLLAGDAATPANILLAGAPGTGKTDLALLTAAKARASAYGWISAKSGIVGETERRARLQAAVAREWTPNVCYTDEITESLPLQRSDFDGDSGASRAVMAALLTTLSDESRRGKSLFIASTNVPWRMGSAMRSRFEVLPVLQPLAQDYPLIVASTARRSGPGMACDPAAPAVIEAAELFHRKGASPRHIRSALNRALLVRGRLDDGAIRFAAQDLTAVSDHSSAIYADLWAIKCCSSASLLPWAEDPLTYPFPPHLQGLAGAAGLNTEELDRRIREFEPHANV